MAELNAVEVSAVLAADTYFKFGTAAAALLNSPSDQHADALGVERLKWIRCEDTSLLLVHVIGKESASVVARKAHRGLCEVVGTEGKELGTFRDLVGKQRGAWEFDHGADDVIELRAGLLDDVVRNAARGILEDGELFF